MKYVFHPDALAEYAEAVKYYATQNSQIAQAFINSIEDTVYRIRESSTRYPEIDEDVRRCMNRKFPTGFTGFFSLPIAIIIELKLQWSYRDRATLGD